LKASALVDAAAERLPVLLVDDDPALVETLSASMEHRYDVLVTTSPLVALRRLEQEDFVVVISDWQMPNMTGIELFRRVRRLSAPVGSILMTGKLDQLVFEISAEDRKWLALLSKPLDLNRLFDKIDQLAAVAMMKRSVERMKRPADSDNR